MDAFEREITISFSDGDDMASIYAASPVWIRKLDKVCESHPDSCRITEISRCDGSTIGKFYEVPKNYIKVSAPRQLSEDAKAKSAERLAAYRERKSQNQNFG